MMDAASKTAERLAGIHAQSGGSQPPAEHRPSQTDQSPATPDAKTHAAGRDAPAPVSASQPDQDTAPASDTTTESGHAPKPAHRPGTIELFLADAGYLSEDNLTAEGPDRLIAVGKRHQQERAATEQPAHGPPPADASPIQQMAHRLRTPEGITSYRRRGPLAEGPFGDHKHNRGFRRFTMRGLPRVTGEWTFVNTVSNLLKIYRTGCWPTPA